MTDSPNLIAKVSCIYYCVFKHGLESLPQVSWGEHCYQTLQAGFEARGHKINKTHKVNLPLSSMIETPCTGIGMEEPKL